MTDYFSRLKHKGTKIDEGIEKLSNIWKKPLIYVVGLKSDDIEAKDLIKGIKNELTNIQSDLGNVKSEMSQSVEAITNFLEETQQIYETLKQDIEDVEQLFLENGYVPEENETESMAMSLSIMNSQEMCSTLTDNDRDTVLSKTNFDASLMPADMKNDFYSKAVSTPLDNKFVSKMNSLQLTSSMDSTKKHTPSFKRLKEPLYCPQYYD